MLAVSNQPLHLAPVRCSLVRGALARHGAGSEARQRGPRAAMADAEQLAPEAKVALGSQYILQAPPGEFNEVYNDISVLLNTDQTLIEGHDLKLAFARYNEEQFTPTTLPDETSTQVLITKHGLLSDGSYYDPNTMKKFRFDHVHKAVSDMAPVDISIHIETTESFRFVFDKAVKEYLTEHYPHGVSTTYSTDRNSVIACFEDHKFQADNFWGGRWRSEWEVNQTTGIITGTIKTQVHYYEDGNVQLASEKKVDKTITVSEDTNEMARRYVRAIRRAENEFQVALNESYSTMSRTSFKALRRALPVTRSKLDWNQILNYNVAKEISKKS